MESMKEAQPVQRIRRCFITGQYPSVSEIQGEVLEGRSVCQRLQEETSSPESSAPKKLYPLTKLQTIALIESLKRNFEQELGDLANRFCS